MIKRTYPQSRLRRVRAKSYLRDLVAENHLSTNDLIQPIFIADQSETRVEIPSMPGIYRHNLQSLYAETEELIKKGIKSVAIFPAIDPNKKDQKGSHAFDDKNITHIDGDLNPIRDIATIETELLLRDIITIEKRLE